MSTMMGHLTRHRHLVRALTIVLCAAALAPLTLAGPGEKAAQDPVAGTSQSAQVNLQGPIALQQQLNDLMGLSNSELQTIEVDPEPGEPFTAQLLHRGQPLTLEADPVTVRADHYQLLVQGANGVIRQQQPSPERSYRGEIVEWPGAQAAVSFVDGGMYAMVRKPDGERVWVEPIERKIADAPADMHIIYRDQDVLDLGGSCGTFVEDIPAINPEQLNARGGACGTGLCFAELANDADFEYFQDWGSVTNVEDRIASVVNAMNVQYENDVDVTHVITAIVVRTAEPDPYSQFDSAGLVSQVRNEWEFNLDDIPRDITQLFTGRNVSGSVIGRAFDIGVVCSSEAYSFSQSDCCGSFARTVELHAHENGHVWNGIHCGTFGIDPCPGFTMATPLNQNPLGAFSDDNIARLVSHRNAIGCLGTSAGLDLPFSDDFDSTVIDSSNWTQVQGATVNSDGDGEPSPPLSLNIDGSDTITSNFIDLEPMTGSPGTILLNYAWQRTGNGNSPEPGEDLFVEFLDDQNQWQLLNQHPGSGPDNDPYQQETVTIPDSGKHPFFRIRIRGDSNNPGSDDFFVDDVEIIGVVPPDDNDFCGFPVVVEDGEPRSFSTVNASTDGFSESGCGGDIEHDIWYQFIPQCTGDVTVSICDADFDARLAVYFISCPTGPDQAIACDDNSCSGGEAEVTFSAQANFTYWIRIGAANPDVFGTGTLNVTCGQPVTGACCLSDGSCSVATEADCTTQGGVYQGDATDCGSASCPSACPADISDPADGTVDVFDLLELLANWGDDGPGADLSEPNDVVDVFDLLELLGAWGDCA